MSLITPDAETERSEQLLAGIQQQLEYLRGQLEAHREGLDTGGKFEETAAKQTFTQVGGLVTACLKLEATLADCRQKRSEIARHGFAFDFDVARSEIACALNRIRDCHRAEPVSE